ncbi:DUF4132 domain-containing protein [Janthinobacterium sp. B9-8]|uniref:DUF4132 domain-containing protein n=1 Tax=Janthinobacterium sp. B9-8 TaxID=1236179 RepID=UPI00061D13B5|nr:DUF4132 domain-containing protein [Janthinobacterium sp. B9-8]AMC35029.1 hypothetical protein VN23_10605 [Janthinobacterium sp. B9-8]
MLKFNPEFLFAQQSVLLNATAQALDIDAAFAQVKRPQSEFRQWADVCESYWDAIRDEHFMHWQAAVRAQCGESDRLFTLAALNADALLLQHRAFQMDGAYVKTNDTLFDREAVLLQLTVWLLKYALRKSEKLDLLEAKWCRDYARQTLAYVACGIRRGLIPLGAAFWEEHVWPEYAQLSVLTQQIVAGQLYFNEEGLWQEQASERVLPVELKDDFGSLSYMPPMMRRIRCCVAYAAKEQWLACDDLQRFCVNDPAFAPMELLAQRYADWPSAYLLLRETLFTLLHRHGLAEMLDYSEPQDKELYFELASARALFWVADDLLANPEQNNLSSYWSRYLHITAFDPDETADVLLTRLQSYPPKIVQILLQSRNALIEPLLFKALGKAQLEALRHWCFSYLATHDADSEPAFGTIDIHTARPLLGELSLDDWAWLKEHYWPADLAKLLGAIVGEGAAALEKSAISKHAHVPMMALGLLPLKNEDECRTRYLQLKELYQLANQYGAQRQGNQRAAVQSGLINLASNAGFSSLGELEWQMEASLGDALQFLFSEQKIGDYSVWIELKGSDSGPAFLNSKGKCLASVPAGIKKEPAWLELKELWEELKAQRTRFIQVLETYLLEQRWLSIAQIELGIEHPLLGALIHQLVWVDEAGHCGVYRAGVLAHPTGVEIIEGGLRLAHPIEWLANGRLVQWQEWAVLIKLQQPFKQVFRELYVPTPAELEAATESQRYAGRWVSTRIAQGIFKSRNWRPSRWAEEATHTKRFVGDVSAHFDFDFKYHYFTEVDTLQTSAVTFTRNGEALALTAVPPLIFSEAMRDLDLLIARAMSSGSEEYSSSETVAARRALIKALQPALGGERIRIEDRQVHLQGHLSNYRINLASAHIHIEPGSYLCVIPAGQSVAKLQLPFEESDHRSSEIISKIVLLLADDKIKDESILQQIKGVVGEGAGRE